MAAVPWIFESGYLESRTLKDAYKIKVEIGYQNTTDGEWAGGLTPPDFSTGAVNADFSIFRLPKIPRVSSPDLGALGAASLSITADNSYLGSDGVDVASGLLAVGRMYKNVGYTTVTHDGIDYSDGQYFRAVNANYTTVGTGTVERYHTIWSILNIGIDYLNIYTVHVRISTMAYGGSYVCRFWGVLDPATLELKVHDVNTPEEWEVKCRILDPLAQLSQRTANQYMEAVLPHATYDYDISDDVFITAVSTFTDNGTSYYPGRYALNKFVVPKKNSDEGDEWVNPDNLRWIKLTDIFETIGEYLGFEASVNNGAAWSGFHSWRFYYNTANSTGTGGTTLSYVGIDNLWVVSQMNVLTVIKEQLTFFDPDGDTAYSMKKMASALEILKKICVSFGLNCRTKVNASNERYLEIVEMAKESATLAVTDYSDIESGIELVPNELVVEGVKVPTYGGGSEAVRGNGEAQNSVQFDQLFTLGNNLRTQYEFKRKLVQNLSTAGARIVDLRPGPDFFCSLWVLTGITGKNATNAYSVCAIMPLSNGAGATSDPGNIPEYGEHYASTGVIYPPVSTPAVDRQYWVYIEVVAWALCHYMWNDVPFTTDPVGFARSNGVRISMNKLSIDHTTVLEPPYLLACQLDGHDYEFLVTESEEDLENDAVSIKGHTRDT